MKENYRIIGILSDGLIILSHPKYGKGMWSRHKARKKAICAISEKHIEVGNYCWSSVGNGRDRMNRIADDIVQNIIKDLKSERDK